VLRCFVVYVFTCNSLICFAQPKSTATEDLKFVYQVPCTEVKDQYMSSTCWSFASNSFLESELLKKGIRVDLSEIFIARHSYINKIKRHLATRGKTYFTPGGQFHDVQRAIREHGIVPEQVYSGKINGALKHNHAHLDTVMSHKVRDLLKSGKTKLNEADLISINKILDRYLGKLPVEFSYKGKKYTAKTFASEFLQLNVDEYLEITSYTHHPFYTSFVLEDRYNWTGDKYYNLPLHEFQMVTDSALAIGYSVCWDGDVTEAGFKFDDNTASVNSPAIKDYQQERQSTFFDKTSTIDHLMHIVGLAQTAKGEKYYYLKNSWGNTNEAGGYIFMNDPYFKIKTIAIIVNKNALPASIRRKLGV
jgi:bleomycin hydrolase